MYGLILSAPETAHDLRRDAAALLDRLEIPFSGFVCGCSPLFSEEMALQPFLFAAVEALLTPGMPIPAALILKHLSADANPGNVIRRYVYLQLQLLPYLRVNTAVTPLQDAHLLGSDLLIPHYNADGALSCPLPDGSWLSLYTGDAYTGRIHRLQSINQPPVLVREGTLLPIGFHDRITDGDDADRLTLHWYQPQQHAECTLMTGEHYTADMDDGGNVTCASTSQKLWHLIVHQDGMDRMIR